MALTYVFEELVKQLLPPSGPADKGCYLARQQTAQLLATAAASSSQDVCASTHDTVASL